MYSTADAGKPLQGASQSVLLQVLWLADQLQAPPCAAAAARALAASRPLDWSTALGVYRLPPSYSDNAAFQPMFTAAAAAVQIQLRDLDAAWLDDGKAEQLLALPFAAVKQLLSDNRTRAREDTVYYTCCAWIDGHKADAEQRRGLLECERMPHISSFYLAGVVSSSITQLTDSIATADLLHAAAYAAATAGMQKTMDRRKYLSFTKHPAWRLPMRPASAVQSAVIEWRVPLSEVKQLHEEAAAMAVGRRAWAYAPQTRMFGGVMWSVKLQAMRQADGVKMGVHAHVCLPPALVPWKGIVSADCKLEAAQQSYSFGAAVGVGESRGFDDAFKLGAKAEWDEVAWSGLAGGDGKVLLRLTVKDA